MVGCYAERVCRAPRFFGNYVSGHAGESQSRTAVASQGCEEGCVSGSCDTSGTFHFGLAPLLCYTSPIGLRFTFAPCNFDCRSFL